MAWEWLAPAGTVIAAGITAGLGGWVVGRQSRSTQKHKHDLERRNRVVERGRAKAEEAVASLRFLQRHQREVAGWQGRISEGDLDATHEQHDRLGRAIPYIVDESVRDQIRMICDVIEYAWIIDQFGSHDVGEPETIIWRACSEGLTILGRYL